MSFQVVRHDDPEDDYGCNLRNMQCKFRLANRERCSRRTIKTIPYCWQHGIKYYGLHVKESEAVPGQLGIFALKSFNPGETVIDHPYGELITGGVAGDRYGDVDNPFLIPSPDGRFWDDTCSRGLMGYVQDNVDIGNHVGGPYNTAYDNLDNVPDPRGVRVVLKCIAPILEGDELLVEKGMDNRQLYANSTFTNRPRPRRSAQLPYRFAVDDLTSTYRRRMAHRY